MTVKTQQPAASYREDQQKREIKMFGFTVAAMKEELERSITFKFSGPAMVAMGMMSDAQEILFHSEGLLSRGTLEEVRQTLNRAKWILSTYVIENDQRGTAALMERV